VRVEGVVAVVGVCLLVSSGIAVATGGTPLPTGHDAPAADGSGDAGTLGTGDTSDFFVTQGNGETGSVDSSASETASDGRSSDGEVTSITQWTEAGSDSAGESPTDGPGAAVNGTTSASAGQADDETDTDGDGLSDSRERALGTDPTDSDSDDDRLEDGIEVALGTDPTDPDSDDDTLLDGWEYYGQTPSGASLPDSDPLAKDVYVQVDFASPASDPSGEFYEAVRTEFAEMPVRNPDNSSGIDLHVHEGGRLNGTATFTGDNFWRLKDDYYADRLGPRAGAYHHVAVVEFEASGVGYGAIGGDFAIVASGLDRVTTKNVVVHELLHNVVGRIEAPDACESDPAHYCGPGWLRHHLRHPEDEFLPKPIARQLETEGFAN
jgi:hypothetical protein